MRKFTKLLLVFVFSLSAAFAFGQAPSTYSPTTTHDTSTHIVTQSPPAGPQDTVKEKRDWQNQTQFLIPDKTSKYYNFYDRKAISEPLQPRSSGAGQAVGDGRGELWAVVGAVRRRAGRRERLHRR